MGRRAPRPSPPYSFYRLEFSSSSLRNVKPPRLWPLYNKGSYAVPALVATNVAVDDDFNLFDRAIRNRRLVCLPFGVVGWGGQGREWIRFGGLRKLGRPMLRHDI